MKKEKEKKQHHTKGLNAQSIKQKESLVSWEFYLGLAFILLISFIIYLPVLQNSLLGWDDDMYIKNNTLVHSFNLSEIFTRNVWGNYHPFTILVLAIEYHFFGLNATGYHAVNLIIHLLNIILVFYVTLNLSRKEGIALVVSLLFGIHPMHVESVAWASELKDLLYTFFFLTSYFFYLKYLKESNRKYFAYALVLFLVSLLSKAMAASLPVVLLLTDYFKEREMNKSIILEKVPFLLLSIIFGIVAVIAQQTTGAISEIANYTIIQRIIFASYGFIMYLIKLVMPLNLSAFYPYPIKGGEAVPGVYYLFLICLIFLAAYSVYSLRHTKKIFFGVGFFAITVFLVLQLLPVGGAIMADRYSYIPSIGIFYLAGEGINYLWVKRQKWVAIIIIGVFTVFFSVKTYARCGVWKDDFTLWNDVIEQYQTIPYAYYNRGIVYLNEKKTDKALEDFNKAIELNPYFEKAYLNRGNLLFRNFKTNDALVDYNKAIELNPNYAEVYFNRGILFMNEKNYSHALKDYDKAIALNPLFYDAYLNKGIIFMFEKSYEAAITNFSKATEINKTDARAFYNKGLAEYYSGNLNVCCKDLQQAAKLGHKQAQDAISQLCK